MDPTENDSARPPVLALSMGDYNGIGPEVILKSIASIRSRGAVPLVFGHRSVFEFYRERMQSDQVIEKVGTVSEALRTGPEILPILDVTGKSPQPEPGRGGESTGRAAALALEAATEAVMRGECEALVTAPVSKACMAQSGFPFPGHTEFLAHKTGCDHYQMILVHEKLRVALATIHIPLSEVAGRITRSLLLNQLRQLNRTLRFDFGEKSPEIAMLALNPHAGDNGLLGEEEQTLLEPAVEDAQSEGITVSGPHAADGFFGSGAYKKYDAILAMYHDQGLIPFKTLSFGRGINVTGGLPIVRTSPDHGTGFAIAGRNCASAESFVRAADLALRLVANRNGDCDA